MFIIFKTKKKNNIQFNILKKFEAILKDHIKNKNKCFLIGNLTFDYLALKKR